MIIITQDKVTKQKQGYSKGERGNQSDQSGIM